MTIRQKATQLDAAPRERMKQEQLELTRRMNLIKHKIIVLSGKGGVGKSTVSTNLALAMSQAGNNIGLLDADIHGPSIPKMLGVENSQLTGSASGLIPIEVNDHLRVMSIGFMLENQDTALIYRGPLKHHTIRQLLKDVYWGKLDYLIIDSPPGTGDEPLTVAQSIEQADGAIVVTTPQQVAISDVRKSITFCRNVGLPVLGVLENMNTLLCPHCGKEIDIFSKGGGEQMAQEMGVPFLGSVPFNPQIVTCGDQGTPFMQTAPDSPSALAFHKVVEAILRQCGEEIRRNMANA